MNTLPSPSILIGCSNCWVGWCPATRRPTNKGQCGNSPRQRQVFFTMKGRHTAALLCVLLGHAWLLFLLTRLGPRPERERAELETAAITLFPLPVPQPPVPPQPAVKAPAATPAPQEPTATTAPEVV